MFKKILYIFSISLSIVLYSCSAKKAVVPTSSSSGRLAEDYVNTYKDIAISEMRRTGVPASITLAQGIIESDYGRSTLARTANNHFGIKCHNGWTGATVRHHDDRRNECFRKYRNVEESFYDHSDFLRTGSRYKSLFELKPDDYKSWARGLKKAGYATNPDYAEILIRSIERNNLYHFDKGFDPKLKNPVLAGPAEESALAPKPSGAETSRPSASVSAGVYARPPRIMENNRIQYIIVKDGDTREKLEKEFGLLKWELSRYNDLGSDFSPLTGQILYLQPKRDKAEAGKDYHTVSEGETMHFISQKYGVKLKNLYEMNRMEKGAEPEKGKRISLRGFSQGS